jgi:FkbM family methyltransferase
MPSYVTVPRNETVLRRFGPYPSVMDVGGSTTAMQRHVLEHGLAKFEAPTQATLLSLVQQAEQPVQFFDVGAHVGLHSVVVALVYGTAVRIHAFEPTPTTARICRAIAAANHLPIRLERCAVSSSDGTAELYISPWDTSNSLTAGFRPAQDVVVVPTMMLDSYCARHDAYPDVIKIDVETFEAQVLLGALQAIERSRPTIVCEVLPYADRGATEQAVGELVLRGYHLHRWLRDAGWVECSAQDLVDQVEHDGRDWLFTPDPLEDGFHDAVHEWLAAVEHCAGDAARPSRAVRPTVRPPCYRPADGSADRATGAAGLLARVSEVRARVARRGAAAAR